MVGLVREEGNSPFFVSRTGHIRRLFGQPITGVNVVSRSFVSIYVPHWNAVMECLLGVACLPPTLQQVSVCSQPQEQESCASARLLVTEDLAASPVAVPLKYTVAISPLRCHTLSSNLLEGRSPAREP